MKKTSRCCFLYLILATLFGIRGEAAESDVFIVYLKNGSHLTGKYDSEREVFIDSLNGGEVSIPKAKILRLERIEKVADAKLEKEPKNLKANKAFKEEESEIDYGDITQQKLEKSAKEINGKLKKIFARLREKSEGGNYLTLQSEKERLYRVLSGVECRVSIVVDKITLEPKIDRKDLNTYKISGTSAIDKSTRYLIEVTPRIVEFKKNKSPEGKSKEDEEDNEFGSPHYHQKPPHDHGKDFEEEIRNINAGEVKSFIVITIAPWVFDGESIKDGITGHINSSELK